MPFRKVYRSLLLPNLCSSERERILTDSKIPVIASKYRHMYKLNSRHVTRWILGLLVGINPVVRF